MKQKQQKWEGRPPDSVIEQRVAEAIEVLSCRPTAHRCELHEQFCKSWNCHWKTVDRIVGRARAEMMERLRRSKEDFRCESLAFYEAKMNDDKASVADQIHARKRVDELLGLDAPRRAELSGPEGGPIATKEEQDPLDQMSNDRLKKLIATLENGEAKREP